nr:ORF2 [Torque teno felis virus]
MTDEPRTPSQKRVLIWTPADDRRAQHCAIWLQSCSRTHQLWCDCGHWTSHIRGICASTADGDSTGAGNGDDGRDIRVDPFGGLVPGPGAER